MPAFETAFLRYLKAAFNFGMRNDSVARLIPLFDSTWTESKCEGKSCRTIKSSHCSRQFAKPIWNYCPTHLLCIFAGIRPEEVCRLDWSNVNIAERLIEVPDESAKTDIRRFVDMEPLLVEWLEYFGKRGGKTTGPISPKHRLQERLRAIRKASKDRPLATGCAATNVRLKLVGH